jgi:hypothetical protein
MLKLKKGREAFQIVDGPDAGKTFRPGIGYDQAPKGYEDRFEKVTPVKAKDLKPSKPVVKPDIEGDNQ